VSFLLFPCESIAQLLSELENSENPSLHDDGMTTYRIFTLRRFHTCLSDKHKDSLLSVAGWRARKELLTKGKTKGMVAGLHTLPGVGLVSGQSIRSGERRIARIVSVSGVSHCERKQQHQGFWVVEHPFHPSGFDHADRIAPQSRAQ
jgi:hypothetical protein